MLLTLPAQLTATPILDAGWEVDPAGDPAAPASDRILAVNGLNEDGPYNYNLAAPAISRITDEFLIGDVYQVFDFGGLILTTNFIPFAAGFGDNVQADNGWTSAGFSSGQVALGGGNHSITVRGDGAGGVPARFFVRIDSAPAPEPGTLSLLGLSLAGLGVFRRRTR